MYSCLFNSYKSNVPGQQIVSEFPTYLNNSSVSSGKNQPDVVLELRKPYHHLDLDLILNAIYILQ